MADLGCSPNAAVAFDFLISKGLTDFQAAAVIGNLQQESQLDPQALNATEGAHGIAQWHNERWQNLLSFAGGLGKSPWTIDTQLEFLWHELETVSSFGLDALRSSTSVEAATIAFQDRFERCSVCATSARIGYAQSALFACQRLGTPTPYARKRPVGVFTAAISVLALVATAGYGTYEAMRRWRHA